MDNKPVVLDNGFRTEPLESNITGQTREVGDKQITFWTKKDSKGERHYYKILSSFPGEKK